jgi:hypothetical protein
LKRFISILLLFAFISVNFSKVIIWVHYELNKAQITEQYCVNKDKPMLHCCGKCQLKKKLAEDDEKQKSPSMPDVKNEITLFNSPLSIAILKSDNSLSIINSVYRSVFHSGIHTSIFHPPWC